MTASVDMDDLLKFCGKFSACEDDGELTLSYCANLAAPLVAHALQYNDPRGITGCIASARTAKTCEDLPECDFGGANDATDTVGNSGRDLDRCTWDENVMRRCEGAVAINGNENQCQTDCSATTSVYELNLSCFMNNSGFAACGVGDGCESEGCVGSIRARCKDGVYEGFSDCDRQANNKQCVLSSLGYPECGIEACTQEGEFCRGTTRVRCRDGVLRQIEDCAEEGFKCSQGVDSEGTPASGCGEQYTGCEDSVCRSNQLIMCDSGAETPVNCRELDTAYSSCQLFESDSGDIEFQPFCAVTSASRDCVGISGVCDGDVAKVCVGGKTQLVDCKALLTNGTCVNSMADGFSDVRCVIPN